MSVASLEAAQKRQAELKTALRKLRIENYRDRQTFAKNEHDLAIRARSIEVERRMLHFLEQSSRQEFASVHQFLALLYRTWYTCLEEVCGIYERPCDQLQCDERCMLEHHCILPLCEPLKIYGCTRHATTHHCGAGKCTSILGTEQWTTVCIFSGVEVGRELAAVTSLAEEMRPENAGGRSAFNMYAAHKHAASVIGECRSTAAGASDEEQRVLRERIDRGERISIQPPIYDSKRSIRRVTKAEWRSFRFDCQVSQAAEEAEKRLVATASNVVDDLLFNEDTRSLLNIQLLAEARTRATTALKDYYSACRQRGVLPCLLTAATHFRTPMRSFTPLPFVPLDTVRRSRLVSHCVRLWEICHRSPFMQKITSHTAAKNEKQQSSCSFVQFCVAVIFLHGDGLYVLRTACATGFSCVTNRCAFVPQDIRMRIELPPEERIDAFGAASTKKMYDHISAADVPERIGVSSASFRGAERAGAGDKLYNERNELTRRKKSRARRATAANSGQKLITVQASINGDRIAAPERDVLPSHLHSSLVGKPGVYEQSFLQIGRNFLRACLNSFDDEELSRQSKWLFAI